MNLIRRALVVASAAALDFAGTALAQTYPNKPGANEIMAAEITSRFARDMSRIINAPEFKAKYFQPLGFEAVGGTPEQFAAFLKADRETGAQKVKISGAKLD